MGKRVGAGLLFIWLGLGLIAGLSSGDLSLLQTIIAIILFILVGENCKHLITLTRDSLLI
jgi:mannose/fructose/N-acetylgalactosamine-specific phosphotransferase system component IIC